MVNKMQNCKNSEGYSDPTACDAIKHIHKEEKAAGSPAFRPLVYICSPYAGDMEANAAHARHYCRYAVDTGYIPLAPHLYFPQFMIDSNPNERNLALFMDIVLLRKCQEVWVFGSVISTGMALEIAKAKNITRKSVILHRNYRRLRTYAINALYSSLHRQCQKLSVSQSTYHHEQR